MGRFDLYLIRTYPILRFSCKYWDAVTSDEAEPLKSIDNFDLCTYGRFGVPLFRFDFLQWPALICTYFVLTRFFVSLLNKGPP